MYRRSTLDELGRLEKQLFEVGAEQQIPAHGVGEISNLMSIIAEGRVQSMRQGRQPYYGLLHEGNPEYDAGHHEPYFIILTPDSRNVDAWQDTSYHEAYVVPESGDKSWLVHMMHKAVELEILPTSEALPLIKKLITYKDFMEARGNSIDCAPVVKDPQPKTSDEVSAFAPPRLRGLLQGSSFPLSDSLSTASSLSGSSGG